jgi:hypothetical protein
MIQMIRDGMFCGESFGSFEEIFDYLRENLGTIPRKMRLDVLNGRTITLGPINVSFLPESTEVERQAIA